MLKFTANISTLFREVPLLERVGAAKAAGFDGIEVQFPYGESAQALRAAADAAELPVVLINGPVVPPHYPWGIAGRPEMRDMFRVQLDTVHAYASVLGVRFVNFLAGLARPSDDRGECRRIYGENLLLAADRLAGLGVQVLIEPLNPIDFPDYQLTSFDDAAAVIAACDGRIGLQFDAYHAAQLGLDPASEFERHLPVIRHLQFADAPGRHEPGTGATAFEPFVSALLRHRYSGWVGAEYHPSTTTADSLGWLDAWRRSSTSRR